jgi:hypothetical protein
MIGTLGGPFMLWLRLDPPPKDSEGSKEGGYPDALSIQSAVFLPIQGIEWE